MARFAGQQTQDHYTLKRPHTIMCLAAVAGQQARRGLLLGNMATKLWESDGRIELPYLLEQAKIQMYLSECIQVPVFLSTLTKRLILPPTQFNKDQDTCLHRVTI